MARNQYNADSQYVTTDPKWGMLDPRIWKGKVTLMVHDIPCPKCKESGRVWARMKDNTVTEVTCNKCRGEKRVMGYGERYIPNEDVEKKKARGWRVIEVEDPTKPAETKKKATKEGATA